MTQTVITGTGRYVPPRVVTNQDMTQWMDTTEEWIEQRTGIHQRHWVPQEGGVGASDLGCEASKIALQRAGWSASDIDLIIFATLSPDIFFPGSGCLLQHKLGLEQTPAIDIRQQCTGFLYGLEMAHAYIYSGMAQRILLVGAEVHSTGLDVSTNGRDVTVIFGDGAGAACVEGQTTDENVGVLASVMHAQGALAESLMLEAPASKCNPRLDQEMLAQGRQYPHMDGRMIFKMAVGRLPKVARETLEKAQLTQDDIDLFIPHQANFRINKAFQKAMDLPDHKVYHNIQRYGNTTAASIPMAYDEALEQQVIKPGNTVMFLGLGAGLTWGSVIYRLPKR
jgi:3-oxoacyl-[acyl-carrier-protein] synthase-3